MDEHYGHEKQLLAKTALNTVTSGLSCKKMALLDDYLTKVRLLFLQITLGGETLSDGVKVSLVPEHLRELG